MLVPKAVLVSAPRCSAQNNLISRNTQEIQMIPTRMQSSKVIQTLALSCLFITGLLGSIAVNAFAAASGSFALTGSLNTARYGHTATLLSSGEVLVTGGLGANGIYAPLASAEIYSPSTGKWTFTGSMSVGRTAFTATLLQNSDSVTDFLKAPERLISLLF